MLNDVRPPPLEPEFTGQNRDQPVRARKVSQGTVTHRSAASRDRPKHHDRAHELDRQADHSLGTDLVFDDPEDRGNSFNTTLSAVIVAIVLLSVAGLVWAMWR
jgi:hypothetical protein